MLEDPAKHEAAEALAVEYIAALLLGDTKGAQHKPDETVSDYQLLVRWRWNRCRKLGLSGVRHFEDYVSPTTQAMGATHPAKLWATLKPKETV